MNPLASTPTALSGMCATPKSLVLPLPKKKGDSINLRSRRRVQSALKVIEVVVPTRNSYRNLELRKGRMVKTGARSLLLLR